MQLRGGRGRSMDAETAAPPLMETKSHLFCTDNYLETTLKNHGNQPKTMRNHETTLKNHGNRPKTIKTIVLRYVTNTGSKLTTMIKKT